MTDASSRHLYCEFAKVSSDYQRSCRNYPDLYGGLLLCRKHARYIARTVRFVAPEKVERQAQIYAEGDIRRLERKVSLLEGMLQAERERGKRAPATTDGVVYFLKSNGFMKIGWTSDLDQRLKQYDPDARVLAVKPGTRKDETALHKKFADLKTHRREWFGITPRLMEEVERTVREHGEPPRELNEPVVTRRIVGPRDENYIGGKRKSA